MKFIRCLVLICLLAAGCVAWNLWLTAPGRDTAERPATDLLLSLSDMPAGWISGGIYTADDFPQVLEDVGIGCIDYASISFHPKGRDPDYERVHQNVYRFDNGRLAMREFYLYYREVPAEIALPPGVAKLKWRWGGADRFRLFCQRVYGCGSCTALAQYGVWLTSVRVSVTCIEHVPLVDLARLLQEVDWIMVGGEQ